MLLCIQIRYQWKQAELQHHVQQQIEGYQYVHHLQGQSVISVTLKTPLQIRLGIGNIKLHFCGFTPICPPTFYNKIEPMIGYGDFDLDQALVYCKNRTIGCRYFNSLI